MAAPYIIIQGRKNEAGLSPTPHRKYKILLNSYRKTKSL